MTASAARVQAALDRGRARIDASSLTWSSLLVFVLLVPLYLATATVDAVQSPDPRAAAIPAWQFAVHGNFNLDAFEGDLRWFIPGREHVVSNRAPGVILFGIPFYWLLPTSVSEPTYWPAAVAAATATAGAMTVLHALFRRFVTPSAAVTGALLAALGTSTWSVSADALWPHGINQLWFASALVFLAAGTWSVAGGFFGLAILTRPHTAFVAAAAGLYSAVQQRSIRPAAVIGAWSLLGVLALVAYNTRMFGAPSLSGGYAGQAGAFFGALTPLGYGEAVLGTLVSPDRGVLVLSPFLLALLPGLRRGWQAAPDWVRAGALAGVGYLLVHLTLNRFTGGHNFFAYRLPLETLTLAAPLLLLAWREWTGKTLLGRRVFVGLACLSVLIHAFGALFWVPTFDERSPWTNLKVLEAVETAGWAAVPLVATVCGLGLVFLWRTAPRSSNATP